MLKCCINLHTMITKDVQSFSFTTDFTRTGVLAFLPCCSGGFVNDQTVRLSTSIQDPKMNQEFMKVVQYCPSWHYVKGDRRFLILTNIYYNMIYIYVFMDPCLGYANAYIWTPNCHVMVYSLSCKKRSRCCKHSHSTHFKCSQHIFQMQTHPNILAKILQISYILMTTKDFIETHSSLWNFVHGGQGSTYDQ